MTAVSTYLAVASRRTGVLPLWAAAALALASGVLLALAYGLHPVWWAAWLGPAPVIAAAVASPPGRGRALGAVAGLLVGATTFSYHAFAAGWPIALAILVARALFWSTLVGIAARAIRIGPVPVAVLLPAAFAAAVDVLVLTLSPHGAYGGLAYSQMDVPLVIQAAAIGGAPAIVFVLVVAGVFLGVATGRLIGASVHGRGLVLAAAMTVGVLAAVFGFAGLRLAGREPGPSIPVALVTTDRFVEPRGWTGVWRAYGPAAAAAARPGGLLVLPEKIALLDAAQAATAAAQVADLARRSGATIAVGLEVKDAGVYRNRALVAVPGQAPVWYDKRRLFLPAEARDRPGTEPLVFRAGGVKAGVAICKDGHFPQIGREYGRAGTRVLLIHAWDFVRDGWMSDRLTALRGVESGYAVVRSTRDGVSSVSDRFGRVLAETAGGPGMSTVVTRLTLGPQDGRTLYTRVGDVFGWLCLGGAILGIGYLRRLGGAAARAGPPGSRS